MVLHDQHIHSHYSNDSNESLVKYYNLASNLKCKYFITTEHLDFDVVETKTDWIPDYDGLINELDAIKSLDGPIILHGLELGFRMDKLNEIKEWVSKYDFDLINLSIHGNKDVDYYFTPFYLEHGINYTLKMYYHEMKEALEIMDDFNVLSHMDYAYKTAYLMDENTKFEDFLDEIKEILTLLIKKNKALEINTKVQKYLPTSHTTNLLKLYKELGGTRVTLSSDAHNADRYLEGFDKYKKIIKDCGFDYLCYYVKKKEYHFDI